MSPLRRTRVTKREQRRWTRIQAVGDPARIRSGSACLGTSAPPVLSHEPHQRINVVESESRCYPMVSRRRLFRAQYQDISISGSGGSARYHVSSARDIEYTVDLEPARTAKRVEQILKHGADGGPGRSDPDLGAGRINAIDRVDRLR